MKIKKKPTQYKDGKYVFTNHNGVQTKLIVKRGLVYIDGGLGDGQTGVTVEEMLNNPRGKGLCKVEAV